MLQTIAALALLFIPALAWANTARLLRRREWRWWSRHLIGASIWHPAALGIFLIAGSTGTFDSDPSLVLGLIGGLIVLPILFWFRYLTQSTISPASVPTPKPAGQLHTASHRPQLLTAEQAKGLKLKEHVPEHANQRKHSAFVSASSAAPTPTRAIRDGWMLCSIALNYEDASGQRTERTVKVHSVNGIYLKGECHARRAERTFRLDRIMSDITDIETGVALNTDEWVKQYV